VLIVLENLQIADLFRRRTGSPRSITREALAAHPTPAPPPPSAMIEAVLEIAHGVHNALTSAETNEHRDQALGILASDERLIAGLERLRRGLDGIPAPPHRPIEEEALEKLSLLGTHALPAYRRCILLGRVADDMSRLRHITPAELRPDLDYLLDLTPLAGYEGTAPPPEVMDLVIAKAQAELLSIFLFVAALDDVYLPPAIALFLVQTMERGWRARVVLSSSVGYEVPEDIVPPSARLDLPALLAQMERTYADWDADARAYAREKQAVRAEGPH
jgi:hypothetical protein